jgi:hypothetical protein
MARSRRYAAPILSNAAIEQRVFTQARSTSDLCRRLSGFRAEGPQSGGQSGGRRPKLAVGASSVDFRTPAVPLGSEYLADVTATGIHERMVVNVLRIVERMAAKYGQTSEGN